MKKIMIILILATLHCFNENNKIIANERFFSKSQDSIFKILDFKGNAEIAQYKGKVKRYNQFRKAHLALITVFEPFNLKQLVKSDTSQQYVLKQNQVLTYQTGVYPYRQMNSLFWKPDLQLLKIVMTSQEWCGQSYKKITINNKREVNLHFHTYWENEADGEYTYKIPDKYFLFYDELPLLLRFIEDDFYQQKIKLFPMLMSSRVNQASWDIYTKIEKPDFKDALLSREKTKIKFKNKIIPIIKFTLEYNGLKDVYYFDWNHPYRILIKWERNDGGYFELDHLSYAKYWELNHKGDKLPENVYRNH
ncbi:MAG: hypothetical protein KatS3mg129_2837 [Leptospiraceae bacterium]|nr:MAG: hypothetical protein KatS3mg129_2837 [Leptospiraceae bacterium]